MPKQAPLPYQFADLGVTLHYVQRVSDSEYSAACPECGDGDVRRLLSIAVRG